MSLGPAPLDVAVIVATYGDEALWKPLADRALRSATACEPAMWGHVHGESLHEARNRGAAMAENMEWLCFLDADDELEPGYFDAMAQGDTDLRAPLVRFVTSRFSKAEPRIPGGTDDMTEGNRLVIGTLIRKELFDQVGGFRDWPLYEDWDLWQRCWLAGATIGFTEAVYRANVRRGSRNRAPSSREKERARQAIRHANLPWLQKEESQR